MLWHASAAGAWGKEWATDVDGQWWAEAAVTTGKDPIATSAPLALARTTGDGLWMQEQGQE